MGNTEFSVLARPCHGNDHRPKRGESKQISYRCDSTLPPRRRFGSEGPQRRPGDEVALKIECVVDGSVHVEEALGRASRLEPLHFTLAASHDLMGILGAIVRRYIRLPAMRTTISSRCHRMYL